MEDSTSTLVTDNLNSRIESISHTLLEEEIVKYQIDKEWLTKMRYDYQKGIVANTK